MREGLGKCVSGCGGGGISHWPLQCSWTNQSLQENSRSQARPDTMKEEFVERFMGSHGLCVAPVWVEWQPSSWWWARGSCWGAEPAGGNGAGIEPRRAGQMGRRGHLCFCHSLNLMGNLPRAATATAAGLPPPSSPTSFSFGQLQPQLYKGEAAKKWRPSTIQRPIHQHENRVTSQTKQNPFLILVFCLR
jgi:hypothetical protein